MKNILPVMFFCLNLRSLLAETLKMENVFVMVKPDGVKRRLVGEVIKRYERKGLYLADIRCTTPTEKILKIHYEHLLDKPFFNDILNYMTSGMVVLMVWCGVDAVSISRKLVGETNPKNAEVGTIRGDFAPCISRNIIHSSDSVESAKKEMNLWLGQDVASPVAFDREWMCD